MRVQRRFLVGSIISFLLIAFLFYFFRYFPIIISGYVTNGIVFLTIGAVVITLLCMIFSVKNRAEAVMTLGPMAMMVLLARSIPNLRLSYPALQDMYYHFVSTDSILNNGSITVTPAYGTWYPYINMQLHWPDMHIITFNLNQIAGVDLWTLFKFQEPFLGIMFMLAVFLLAFSIFKRYDVALLAGIIASFSDVIIFYQSEYHPQGLGLIFFVLLIYIFIRTRERNERMGFAIILLILLAATTLSHHFTTLVIAGLMFVYIIVGFVISKIKWFNFPKQEFKTDIVTSLLIGITMISYHVYVEPEPLKAFLSIFIKTPIEDGADTGINTGGGGVIGGGGGGGTVPSVTPSGQTSINLLPYAKYVVFIIAFLAVLYFIKKKSANPNVLRTSVFLGIIMLVGVVGFLASASSPTERFIAMAMPLAAILIAFVLFNILDLKLFNSRKALKYLAVSGVVLISATPIVAGILNSPSLPAYFYHDSQPDSRYWYANTLPDMDRERNVGEWLNINTGKNVNYSTNFDTKPMVFYFGEKEYFRLISWEPWNDNYSVENPTIPYNYPNNGTYKYPSDSIIFSNSQLLVHYLK